MSRRDEILHDWNPWWSDKDRLDALMGRKRTSYISRINEMMKTRHVISITGIRRSGKTTIMYQTINELIDSGVDPGDILFLNMDDERLVGAGKGIEEMLKGYLRYVKTQHEKRSYIFIDEVHNIEGCERVLKRYYDQKKDLKFVVSGSSWSLVSSDYSKLLTGRNLILEVYPLSFREFLDFKGTGFFSGDIADTWSKNREREDQLISELEDHMRTGGFPEIVLGEGGRRVLEEYVKAIIYRDIVSRYNIRNV